jgi:serine/threonine protein kinase
MYVRPKVLRTAVHLLRTCCALAGHACVHACVHVYVYVYVLQIVRWICGASDEHFEFIAMDMCTNGTLAQVCRSRKCLTEPEVCYYAYQTVSALAYLTSRGIVHGDIKPGNLFLSAAMRVRVGDFGLASLAGACTRACGTPNYIAPEVLQGKDVRVAARIARMVPYSTRSAPSCVSAAGSAPSCVCALACRECRESEGARRICGRSAASCTSPCTGGRRSSASSATRRKLGASGKPSQRTPRTSPTDSRGLFCTSTDTE